MKYEDAKKFYEEFRNMGLRDITDLINQCNNEEEKLFFAQMSDYFLQIQQKEYINKPFER